jgi:hypothetical protein
MEKLVITIWFGFAGLKATLGSVPPVVSVLAKFGLVLLTAGSTTTGFVTPEGSRGRGERSSGIAEREGWLRSGGELGVARSVELEVASNEKGSPETGSADAAEADPIKPITIRQTRDNQLARRVAILTRQPPL